MSNNKNHIDNWLIESASMGNVPVDTAHWQAMQQLLQPKRRRKFIFWWWLVGLLLIAGAVIYFILKTENNNANAAPKKITSSQQNANTNSSEKDRREAIQTNIDSTATAATMPIEKAKDSGELKEKTKQSKPQNLSTTQTLQQKNNAVTSIIKKNNDNANEKKLTTPVNSLQIPLNNSKTISHKKQFAKNNSINTNAKKLTTPTNGLQIPLNNSKNISQPKPFTKNNAAANNDLQAVEINNTKPQHLASPMYMHNRYIDSANRKNVKNIELTKKLLDTSANKKDTTTHKKTTVKNKINSQPTFFQIGVGYGLMSIANSQQMPLIQLQYSHKIFNNLYVDIQTKIFPYNNSDTQIHTLVNHFGPSAGSMDYVSDYSETQYKVAKGISLQPSIGLHYKINKIELGVAFQTGFIANNANTVTQQTDTFQMKPYSQFEERFKKVGGGNYDPNNFIGKLYTTASFNCTYSLTKKWKLQVEYDYLLSYNKVEGVLDDNKKRNSFSFMLGYRF